MEQQGDLFGGQFGTCDQCGRKGGEHWDTCPLYAPPQPKQDAELRRVGGKVAPLIREFAEQQGAADWHAGDLVGFVESRGVAVAPESCNRILREMRKNGELDYQCVSKPNSLYRFKATD